MSSFDLAWMDTYLRRHPEVLFDVGCYDCEDSMRFKAAYPACRVVAFEACPDNYEWMKARDIKGVELVHYAVCDRCGTTEFRSNSSTFGDHCSGSILAPNDALRSEHKHLTFAAPRQVPCITLDEFCKQIKIVRVDAIHMDIQGAEWHALSGMGSLRPKLIFLEVGEIGHYDGACGASHLLFGMGYRRQWSSGYDDLWVFEEGM